MDLEALGREALALMHELGVTLEIGRYHPQCEPARRVIRLPDPATLPTRDPRTVRILSLGFVFHECGHLLFTEPALAAALGDPWPGSAPAPPCVAAGRAAAARWGPPFASLALAVEDVRVDRLVGRRWPEGGRLLAATAAASALIWGDLREGMDAAGAFERIWRSLLLVGRRICERSALPAPARGLVEALVEPFARALAAETTADVLDSTDALLAGLEALAEVAAAAPGLAEESPGGLALEALTAPRSPPPRPEEGERVAEILGPLTRRRAGGIRRPLRALRGGRGPYAAMNTARDQVVIFDEALKARAAPAWASALADAARAGRALADVFAERLRADVQGAWARGLPCGAALEPASLALAAVGLSGPDVWMAPRTSDAPATAVFALVDCSGSMSENGRAATARLCAAALHLALRELVAHAIGGFTTAADAHLAREAGLRRLMGEDLSRFGRTATATRHLLFKGFEDGDPRGLGAIEAGGCNADGEAVAWASALLLERPEARRLLLVLSDGRPNIPDAGHGADKGAAEPHLKAAVAAAEAAGVEVVGVGIQTDAVEAFYRDAVMVEDLDALPGALAEILEVLLRG